MKMRPQSLKISSPDTPTRWRKIQRNEAASILGSLAFFANLGNSAKNLISWHGADLRALQAAHILLERHEVVLRHVRELCQPHLPRALFVLLLPCLRDQL